MSLVINSSVFASCDYLSEKQLHHVGAAEGSALEVASFACQRIGLLAAQSAQVFPRFTTSRFTYLPLGILALNYTIGWGAKKYLARQEEEKNPILSQICTSLVMISDHLNHFQNHHLNHLITLASVVTHVAMIALGSPIAGAIGLGGLALIGIDKLGFIPPYISQAFVCCIEIFNVYTDLFSLMGISSLLGLLSMIQKHGSNLLSRYPNLTRKIPGYFDHPFDGAFQVSDPFKKARNMDDHTKDVIVHKMLKVDMSSVFAREETDYRGAIHQELRSLRGRMIDQAGEVLHRKVKKIYKEQSLNMNDIGKDPKRLTSFLHRVVWHRFPTAEGEKISRSFFDKLVSRYLATNPCKKISEDAIGFSYTNITWSLNINNFSFLHVHEKLEKCMIDLAREYKKSLVTYIHDTVKQGTISIAEWEADITKRMNGLDLTESTWTENDQPTEHLITLLLWDMGILQRPQY